MEQERARLVEEAEELLYVQRGSFLAEYQRALGDQQSQMAAQQQQTYAAASNAVSSAEMQTQEFHRELSQERKDTLRLQVELRQALEKQHEMSEQMEEMLVGFRSMEMQLAEERVRSFCSQNAASVESKQQAEKLTKAEYDLAETEIAKAADEQGYLSAASQKEIQRIEIADVASAQLQSLRTELMQAHGEMHRLKAECLEEAAGAKASSSVSCPPWKQAAPPEPALTGRGRPRGPPSRPLGGPRLVYQAGISQPPYLSVFRPEGAPEDDF